MTSSPLSFCTLASSEPICCHVECAARRNASLQPRIIRNQVEFGCARAAGFFFNRSRNGERAHWAIRFCLPGVRAGAMIGNLKMGDYPTEQEINERWKRLHRGETERR